jgi:hypothetical protein
MWLELYALEKELPASDGSPYGNLALFRGVDEDGHFTKKRLSLPMLPLCWKSLGT